MKSGLSNGGSNPRARVRWRGQGTDISMFCLPLPLPDCDDHSLCKSHHGPLQRHPHVHVGGAASGWLTGIPRHSHSMLCSSRPFHREGWHTNSHFRICRAKAMSPRAHRVNSFCSTGQDISKPFWQQSLLLCSNSYFTVVTLTQVAQDSPDFS